MYGFRGLENSPETMPLYGMTTEQPLEEGARHRRRIDCPDGAAFYVME